MPISASIPERAFDTVVLGSGFAGLAAAKLLSEAGRDFCVVARDFGATRHFSGAFDLIDPRWSGVGGRELAETDLTRHFSNFIAAHPGHLYAELSGGDAAGFAAKLIAEMKSFLEFYRIEHRGDGRKALAVFGSTGRMKPTAYAMATHAVTAMEFGLAAACVGFPFLTEYPLAEIAGNLKGHFASVTPIELPDWPVNRASVLASLELQFDRSLALEKFGTALKGRLGNAKILFIPPILGRESHLKNHEALESALGVRVVELLSALPAAAGSRFCAGVEKVFAEKKIAFVRGEVSDPVVHGQTVQSLLVSPVKKDPSGGVRVAAREFILASGKFIGGGITHHGQFEETLFRLPLAANGAPLDRAVNVAQMISADGVAAQPFLNVGLANDPQGRPSFRGRPVYDNLKACGHVLSGFDFTRERCGFGASLASAMAAVPTGR